MPNNDDKKIDIFSEFTKKLNASKMKKRDNEKYTKAFTNNKDEKSFTPSTIDIAFIARLFDGINTTFPIEQDLKKFHNIVLNNDEKLSKEFYESIIHKTRAELLTPEGKLQERVILFIATQRPDFKEFTEKYKNSSLELQQIIINNLVYSLAHAHLTTLQVETSSIYSDLSKPEHKQFQDALIDYGAKKYIASNINTAIKHETQKKSDELISFIHFCIQTEAKATGFLYSEIEKKAKELNEKYNLGLVDDSLEKSSIFNKPFLKTIFKKPLVRPMADQLLEWIGKERPFLIKEIQAFWKKQVGLTVTAEHVGLILKRIGMSNKEYKIFMDETKKIDSKNQNDTNSPEIKRKSSLS